MEVECPSYSPPEETEIYVSAPHPLIPSSFSVIEYILQSIMATVNVNLVPTPIEAFQIAGYSRSFRLFIHSSERCRRAERSLPPPRHPRDECHAKGDLKIHHLSFTKAKSANPSVSAEVVG